MKSNDSYSDALVLSEGRYREREHELVEIEPLPKKSLWMRISPTVVKRIATLSPVYDDAQARKVLEGPLMDVMKEKLAVLKARR